MIHGIYVRTKPKNRWHLFSVAVSQEIATQDLKTAKNKCILEGYDHAEVGVQVFDSGFHIPEFLNDIKNDKIMFN
jgi:hypothetical protein